PQGAIKTFCQDWTAVDRYDVVCPRAGKPDMQHVMAAAPRMKNHAAAPFAVRVDERSDRCLDPGLTERGNDEASFPVPIGLLAQMLHGAAAAHPEMRADRLDALCTRLLYTEKLPAVRVPGHGVDFDDFARQGAWHVNRSVGAVDYPIAVLTQAAD